MKKTKRTDVIIAGAGPVGMFTALCLRKHDLAVEIFDTLPHASTHSYALALHPDSLALLDRMGVLDRLQNEMHQMRKIALFQGKDRVADVDLTTAGMDYPFIAVVPQRALERALEGALRDAGVTVHWNHRVSALENGERGVSATASEIEQRTLGYAIGHTEQFVRRNHAFEANFIVGADGHDSFVRRSLGIDFNEVGPAQTFAVFEFKGEGVDDEAMQVFRNGDGLVSVKWPLGEGAWRWSFEVPEHFLGQEERRRKDPDFVQLRNGSAFPALDRDQLEALLKERVPAPWNKVSVENLYWRVLVRFEKRLATKFGEVRSWLVGDAAHLTGPIGVQSMNVGLREGLDLAARIAKVSDAKASIDVFEEYNQERLAEWRFLLGISGGVRPGAEARGDLAGLAPVLPGILPASGYKLGSLARRLGFEVEDMPVGTGKTSAA